VVVLFVWFELETSAFGDGVSPRLGMALAVGVAAAAVLTGAFYVVADMGLSESTGRVSR
jgi:hypothetical protein